MRSSGSSCPVALHVVESEAHHHGKFIEKSRLEGAEPVLRHADQRRCDRLMGTALRRKRDAGGGRDQHEARILIAGIIELIGRAQDEGVVKRADRQEALAVDRMREAKRAEHDEEV